MLKVLKIKEDPNDILFISDLHLSHNKEFVFGARGFKSPYEHDDYIFKHLQDVAGSDKTLINLGDACLSENQTANFERLSRINFKEHYFVWGNHNAGVNTVYKQEMTKIGFPEQELYPLKINNVTFCGDVLEVHINNIPCICAHFPHRIWNHCNHDAFHLSGHVHSNMKESSPNYPDDKILDVGVDTAIKTVGRPFFTFAEIQRIMKKKTYKKVDHH